MSTSSAKLAVRVVVAIAGVAALAIAERTVRPRADSSSHTTLRRGLPSTHTPKESLLS